MNNYLTQEITRSQMDHRELVSLRLTKRTKTVVRKVVRLLNASESPYKKNISEQDFYQQALVEHLDKTIKKLKIEAEIAGDPNLCNWKSSETLK